MTECNNCSCSDTATLKPPANRAQQVKRARQLALITIGWNLFEGIAALALGSMAGSIALLGFGLDSAIETASAAVVGWRFSSDDNHEKTERQERIAAKTVGALLLCLACYVAFEAIRKLTGTEAPAKESILGIGLTLAALVIMPLLANAKYKSARSLNSAAMKAEAFQSLTCAWLAASTLLGLVLNALFHWTWADPAAALLFVPAIIKEATEALRGNLCSDCH